MALLDKVTDDLNLFIGGLFTLRRKEALQASKVTHILSILRLPLDQTLFTGFTHKVIELDDIDDENILEHFPAIIHFIQSALATPNNGILVHCAMGKSRSATAVIAYLCHTLSLTPSAALQLLRQARPICEPNDGFMTQLNLWHAWGMPLDDLHTFPPYERWLYHREVELSRACGQAPDRIRFEDEHVQQLGGQGGECEVRCRKCRRQLATSRFLLGHEKGKDGGECSHFFLDPLSWMRGELEQGKLDGRLECPKCRSNVGKYAWQGMKCSCGQWVLPGISLAKSKVDQVGKGGGSGIRMPPGMVRKGGQENL